MTIKLDQYYLSVLLNGLSKQRTEYDRITNNAIDDLLLRLIAELETMKPNRKKKISFQPVEVRLIRKCLVDWRSKELQAEKEVAVEVIGELLLKFMK